MEENISVPKSDLVKLLDTLTSLKNSMHAHPDCEEDSEFMDYFDLANEQLNKFEKILQSAG